jgi:hypothetical protein
MKKLWDHHTDEVLLSYGRWRRGSQLKKEQIGYALERRIAVSILLVFPMFVAPMSFADQPATPSLSDLERQLESKRTPSHAASSQGPFADLAGGTFTNNTVDQNSNPNNKCTWTQARLRTLHFGRAQASKLEGNITVINQVTLTRSNQDNCQASHIGQNTYAIVLETGGVHHSVATDSDCLSGECRDSYGPRSGLPGTSSHGTYEVLSDGQKLVLRYGPDEAYVYKRK